MKKPFQKIRPGGGEESHDSVSQGCFPENPTSSTLPEAPTKTALPETLCPVVGFRIVTKF